MPQPLWNHPLCFSAVLDHSNNDSPVTPHTEDQQATSSQDLEQQPSAQQSGARNSVFIRFQDFFATLFNSSHFQLKPTLQPAFQLFQAQLPQPLHFSPSLASVHTSPSHNLSPQTLKPGHASPSPSNSRPTPALKQNPPPSSLKLPPSPAFHHKPPLPR